MTRLYWRLLLWFCVANLVTLLVSVFVTRHLARELFHDRTDWHEIAQQVVDGIGNTASPSPQTLHALRDRFRRAHIDIGLLDADGQVLIEPPPPLRRHLAELLSGPEVMFHPRPDINMVGLSIPGPDGRPWHFLGAQFPKPPDPAHLWLPFLIEILVSALVIGIVGWRVAGGISRPVIAVQAAARRVARGELSARVAAPFTEGPDEIGQLARDFDIMATRIESLVERQRGVLQDVSHEFRSPLARLGVALELARADAGTELPSLARAEREIARLDRLIGEVLELARMEDQLPGMARQRLDLATLAQSRVDELAADLAARNLTARVDAVTPCIVDGSEVLLARAVDNLLSNAMKFSPPGSAIVVTVRSRGDIVDLSVADAGPGVPDAELATLFRPFFRGSNAAHADGQGLGLAIVARIVGAHGGHCEAANRSDGGLCVTLSLPTPTPADAGA